MTFRVLNRFPFGRSVAKVGLENRFSPESFLQAVRAGIREYLLADAST
jgi:hypothetical protein